MPSADLIVALDDDKLLEQIDENEGRRERDEDTLTLLRQEAARRGLWRPADRLPITKKRAIARGED